MARCSEGLQDPHTKAIRPLTFDPSIATGRDDVILAHLNHRLVQMCLHLLRAEVWSTDETRKLNRVSACVSSDPALENPVVIAHGRIVVLGGDNHRLHEEVIMAGGIIREGRYSRLNVGETKSAHDSATKEEVPPKVLETLKDLWPKISDSVLSALENRMSERTKNLENAFAERAETEVKKLNAILEELKRVIGDELAKRESPQLLLDFSKSEKDQRNRDLAALRARLEEIPGEMERESENLRSRYTNPTARLFPVAVTYVVPRSSVAEIGGHAQ